MLKPFTGLDQFKLLNFIATVRYFLRALGTSKGLAELVFVYLFMDDASNEYEALVNHGTNIYSL